MSSGVDVVEVAKDFWRTASPDDHLSTIETIALCRVVLAAAEWQKTRGAHMRMDYATDAEIDAHDAACDALLAALRGGGE